MWEALLGLVMRALPQVLGSVASSATSALLAPKPRPPVYQQTSIYQSPAAPMLPPALAPLRQEAPPAAMMPSLVEQSPGVAQTEPVAPSTAPAEAVQAPIAPQPSEQAILTPGPPMKSSGTMSFGGGFTGGAPPSNSALSGPVKPPEISYGFTTLGKKKPGQPGGFAAV